MPEWLNTVLLAAVAGLFWRLWDAQNDRLRKVEETTRTLDTAVSGGRITEKLDKLEVKMEALVLRVERLVGRLEDK